DINADRFLAIDIRPRFHCRNRVERVPVIGRTDNYDVEIFVLQHFTMIVVSAWTLLRFLALACDFDRSRQHVFIGIANRHDFNWRDLNEPPEIALAIPARADKSYAPWFAVHQIKRVRAPRG